MTRPSGHMGQIQLSPTLVNRLRQFCLGLFKAVILTGLCFVMLYPVLYILSYGFRSLSDLYNPAVVWLPRQWSMRAMKIAWQVLKFPHATLKTMSILVPCVILQLWVVSLAGYGLSRTKFPGRGLLFGLLLFTIIVPVQSYIIPLYVNLKSFDWFGVGSLIGLFTGSPVTTNLLDSENLFYLQSALGMGIRAGLCIFIVRQFFRGLPVELEEAAMMDGCGPLRTFMRVMLPNAVSLLATVGVFSVVWYWNDYTLASFFYRTDFPLSVNLTTLRSALGSSSQAVQGVAGISGQELLLLREPILACGCLLTVLPIVIFYAVVQRCFTEGAERSGIVG